jgi:hypothetical protein
MRLVVIIPHAPSVGNARRSRPARRKLEHLPPQSAHGIPASAVQQPQSRALAHAQSVRM